MTPQAQIERIIASVLHKDFVKEGKQVSNQFIYDQIKEILK